MGAGEIGRDGERIPQHPGPDPEHLKIDLPWEDAVKKALQKKPRREKDAPQEKKGSEGT